MKENMVFELINPLKQGELTAGRVTKVLKFGYFLYELLSDLPKDNNHENSFFDNINSSKIFPCGFCQQHNLLLTPPAVSGDDGKPTTTFSWDKYFEKTKTSALPLHLLPKVSTFFLQ